MIICNRILCYVEQGKKENKTIFKMGKAMKKQAAAPAKKRMMRRKSAKKSMKMRRRK